MTKGSHSSARTSHVPPGQMREVEHALAERVARRDRLAEAARTLRREAQAIMGRAHAGRAADADLARLRPLARRLARETATGVGARDAAVVADALQEWAEATLLAAVQAGRPLPGLTAVGVPAEAYLLGLADLVGELRRLAVTSLGRGKVREAEAALDLMEEVTLALQGVNAPRALLPLKPKQDTARGLVERTRGEVALAQLLARAGASRLRSLEGEEALAPESPRERTRRDEPVDDEEV